MAKCACGGGAAGAMARKFCVGGNWKMNGSKQSIEEIVKFLKAGPLDPNVEVIVGVPAIYLESVKSMLPPNVAASAQNCYKVPNGAFTGRGLGGINDTNVLHVAS